MDIISISAAVISLCVALLSTRFISNSLVVPSTHGRFLTIDGLRGYLAFFVFLHHSCIWYYYLQTGVWAVPPSQLFVHFGQDGVALFFMITGFLFFSKLLDSRDSGLDWLRLYVSRFLRLTPLYFFSMILLFSIVFIMTKDGPAEPISKIFIGIIKWLSFTIFGGPELNGLQVSNLINAGVTWSLPYEWFFYIALPLIALVVGLRPPLPYLIVSALLIAAIFIYFSGSNYYWLFGGGMVAAVIVRFQRFRNFAISRWATALVVVLVSYTVIHYPSLYGSTTAKVLLTIAFCLVAGGNSVFGALKNRISRALGEMAYSIYLLHGILLFVTFQFVIGLPTTKGLTPLQYWAVIIMLAPVLILICGATFRFLEKPAMKKVRPLTEWLRAKNSTPLAGEKTE
ncbi:acyltransferase family protein [Pseudomonas sp. NFX224]|uniref:acyltransferase family protein n=1 Tax=Pseudomonas sp. NFX224 TaxID=3402862 RepID=UPI003AFA3C22